MPQSRNRHGHAYQKPAAIPAKQRVKGPVIWAILFVVFGTLVAFFAAGANYLILLPVAIVSGIVGYVVGKNMEQDAGK